VNGNVHISGTIAQDAWTAVTFQNSWVNYGTVYAPVAYFKDKNGIVHLRGVIKSGTCGSVSFTLPAGYRPAYELAFAAVTSGGIGRVDVVSDGTVLPGPGGVDCNNLFMTLDGITFLGEQ
jgi:hypothetical protein